MELLSLPFSIIGRPGPPRGAAVPGLGAPAIHLPARTATDAAGAGRVVHVVLQVSERQRARSQFTVARMSAGNRPAHQIHVAGIDVVAAISGKQAALLADTLIAAAGLACAGIAVGIPRGTERHLHAATHLAVPGHALGNVLQRLDRQRAAGLDVDAISGRRGATQRGIALGLHRDVLAGQRGVLPGAALGIGLAAANTGFGVHVHAGLRPNRDAHADFRAGIAALAAVGHMRLACFQQNVAGRIQAERVACTQVALHHMDVALGASEVDVAAALDGGATRHPAAAIGTAVGGLEADACFSTEQFAATATAGKRRDRTGCLVRVGARRHALHLLQAIIGLTGRVHVVDQVDQRRLHPREHADLQVLVALRVVAALVGGQQLDLGGGDVHVLGGHHVAGRLRVLAPGGQVHAAAKAADAAGHL